MNVSSEQDRLAALTRLAVLDSEPEAHFDNLVKLVAARFRVRTVLISLVSEDRQWFKARVGLDAKETARDIAFCDHAIRSADVLVVPDARNDNRFKSNPLVTMELGVRFYAGAPLTTPDGHHVGTLCLLDREPRATFSETDIRDLAGFAAGAMQALLTRADAIDSRLNSTAAAERHELLGLAEKMAKVGTWVVDFVTGRTHWSEETYRIYGCDPALPPPGREDALSQYAPEDARRVSALVDRALREGVGYEDQAQITCSGGTIKQIATSCSCRRNENGVVEALYGVVQDITALKLAHTEQKANESRLRLLTDHASDLIIQWDTTGTISFASPSARRWGYGTDELVGRSISDFVHPDDLAEAMELFGLILADEGIVDQEQHAVRCRAQDGQWIWFEGNPVVVRDGKGKSLGIVTVLRDITQRRVQAAALKEQQELFEAAFACSAIGKVVLDPSGRILRVNSATCEALGYTEQELVGMPDDYVSHPDEIGRFDDQFRDLVSGKIPSYRVERRYRNRDGIYVWFSLVVSMARLPDGTPSHIVGELQDLTERHATESELRRKRLEAEAAVMAKAEFLSNMSHELRTPLTGIIGFAGLLERMGGLPEKARTYVSRVASAGEALLGIVNDILDFTKLEAGHVELDPHPFAPKIPVQETLHLLETEARRKGLDLRSEFDPGLPPMLIADSARIRQVLLNFVGNAIKFTPRGQVTVSESYDAASQTLLVKVTDTGIGIPMERRNRLFQRFSQIDGSVSREFGGTGLGLAISKGLVEMMGGEIGVESLVGVGSTFWFTVTATLASSAASNVAVKTEEKIVAPLRILVVDDVDMNRELLAELLKPLGAQVIEARDGADAVATSMASGFDLILMDLQMPGMDGYAATRAIRANSELNCSTPIFGFSANVLPEHIEACRAAGMNDHISKPIDPDALMKKVVQIHQPPYDSLA